MKGMVHRFTVVALAAVSLALPVGAEVSVSPNGRQIFFEAAPGRTWTPVAQHDVPSERLLNPFGDARGDGAPSIELNPVTGVAEVAWGRAGLHPAVEFASWDVTRAAWTVRDIGTAGDESSWAGRVVQLTHDDTGNRYVLFEDSETHEVLLASAPRDSHLVNRPILISTPGTPSTSPSMAWDGTVLVIAYRRMSDGGVDILAVEASRDDEGRIPNGGEGVPGIPEPVFQYCPALPKLHSPRFIGVVPTPGPANGTGAVISNDDVPSMVRVEIIGRGDVLVTWVVSGALAWIDRVGGVWQGPRFVALSDPVDHEAARDAMRHQLAGVDDHDDH